MSKLGVTLDILNQKGTPAFYSDIFTNRPAAGFAGRVFISTDTGAIYEDTGSAWTLIADAGAGTTGTLQQVTANGNTTNFGIIVTHGGIRSNDVTNTSLTAGSVTFAGTGGLMSQDNTNLFWDNTNKYFGIGPTGGPTAPLDIHNGSVNVLMQLNATSTNNSNIAFLNGGVGKWRVGNLYNAGANSFQIYDVLNSIARLTILNTGVVNINTATSGTGTLNVYSASSDNHINAIGATSPSIRIDNAVTSATQRIGLGLATATNNFIQGSASGNMCIFNQSTTPSPILFGVYNTGLAYTPEAMRVSSLNNLLVGSSTDDTVNKLQVTGSSNFNGNVYVTAGNKLSFFSTNQNVALQALNNNTLWIRTLISGSGALQIESLGGTGSRAVLADSSGLLSAPVSDISVKQNISTIGYGLNEILKMNPVWFDYIDEYKNYGQSRQNGNIAQEMESIIPEAVFTTPSTGKMGINYDQLHAVYIKAIQELKAEIDSLKKN